ncbi:MAG: Rrf2 family transcriptional regulator [Verrucomicrobiae bacterium]|nr:Rrf2 family transcriptional regulator [Verrucomicrobiae bacterium]
MKLSSKGEYALRALIVLGENYERGIVRIQTISEQQRIPKRFLEQILNDLKSGGFLESRRGVAGGYRLARPPEQITLAALIRHIEGALVPTPVLSEQGRRTIQPPNEAQAAIRSVMKEVREAILEILDRVTIADLCDRVRRLRSEAGIATDYVI